MRLQWVFFFLGVYGGTVQNSEASFVSEKFCFERELAKRPGKKMCWARYDLLDGRRVCFQQRFWQQWLISSSPSVCGTFRGKWKFYSISKNTSQMEEKIIFRTFRVSHQVDSLPQSGLNGNSPFKAVERLREQLSAWVRPKDTFGVVRKLLVNEGMSGGAVSLLRSTGFIHLVTATGIHLYAVARIVYAWSFHVGVRLGVSISTALIFARVFSFFFWGGLWLLEGLREGMLRPWMVVCLRGVGRYFGLRWRTFAPLLLVLSFDWLFGKGLWLRGLEPEWGLGRVHYALAVGGGLLVIDSLYSGGRNEWNPSRMKGLRDHFALSVGSWYFTAVWDAWTIRWISTATPLLSLATIPIFSLWIYPALLFSALLSRLGWENSARKLAETATEIANVWVEWLWRGTLFLDMNWWIHRELFLLSAVLGFMAVCFLREKRRGKRMLSVLLVGVLIRLGVEGVNGRQEFVRDEVSQLDVGQGDSAFVSDSQSKKVGLIDTGSPWGMGDWAWIEFFLSRGVTHLDWVAVTHFDQDHIGGLEKLERLISIDCRVTSLLERGSERARQWRSSFSTWKEGCFPYVAFSPDQLGRGKGGNQNMSALFVFLRRSSVAYLNLGDASARQEKRWLQDVFPQLENELAQSTHRILKISHHGSRYSTHSKLIQRYSPHEAWISVGAQNRYGHPAREVMERLQDEDVLVKRTDQQGIIEFFSSRVVHDPPSSQAKGK